MDSRNDDIFGGEPSEDTAATGAAPRRRWPWVAAVVVLAVAAVAGGVAVAGTMGPAASTPAAVATSESSTPTASEATTPSPTATADASGTASASATPAATASQTATPAAGAWQTFTSPDGKISFDHPAAWRVSSPAGSAGSGAVDVDVANEAAVVVASLHFGPAGGIGGACQGPVPYTVLDVVEVDLPYQPTKGSISPRFAFRALQEADHVTASYGLTSTLAGQNGTTCMFYNVVNGPAESPLYSFADAFQVNTGGTEQVPDRRGAKTFPSMDAARAYMQTPEYLNAKRMITSLKVNAG